MGEGENGMIEINIGDEQPEECPRCKDKYGYQYYDSLRTHYIIRHTKSGESDGGDYSEYQPLIHAGKKAYCSNCGKRLLFNVIRN